MIKEIKTYKIMNKYNKYIPKDSFRLHVYKRFLTLFPKNELIAINIERSIFSYCITTLNMQGKFLDNLFHSIYINKCVVLYRNLDKNNALKNNYLHDKVLSNEILPESLVSLSPNELFPERYADILQKNYDEKIAIEKIMTATDKTGETDMFKCSKCHQRKCSYYLFQTRSGDENSTTFVTCICGHKWRFN
jgi:DNA-directed RNA polymerase subunit M/transcription elongation factor TFIIS